MNTTTDATGARLRWGRALLAAFVAELALIAVAAPIYAGMGSASTDTLDIVIPAASFVAFLVAGYWSALPVASRGAVQGAVTGVWAIVLYIGLGLIATLFVNGTNVADGFTTAYLIAHALKVIGGAIGGWLAARKAMTRDA